MDEPRRDLEAALEALVLAALGDELSLVSGRLDDSALVMRDLWDQVTDSSLQGI